MSETLNFDPQLITHEHVPLNRGVEAETALGVGDRALTTEIDLSWLDSQEDAPFMPDFNAVFNVLDSNKGVFADESSRLEYFKSLKGQQLLEVIDTYHSLMVPEEFKEAIDSPAMVGRNVRTAHNPDQAQYVASQLFIEPSDRQDFSDYITEKVNEAETLDQVADTVAFAVLNLHAYADGNGRTSRLLHSVIKDGYDGSDDAKKRIQEFATPRDAVTGGRPMSFNVEGVLKEALLDEVLAERGELEQDSVKKFESATSFKDQYNGSNISPSIVEAHLRGVTDEDLKKRLVKVVQQSGFGRVAMDHVMATSDEVFQGYDTLDVYARLASVDDTKAREIIDIDREVRKRYMQRVIDIAAGETVTFTNKFTGKPDSIDARGLTMSTRWQAEYLKAA
ncbi:Fic family protein [Candidatus Saccharibacteria bacterium]|nr:Fic family protein [Candidatus Saccharibacteria bacterium]